MRLDARLTRLEQRRPPRRCASCRDWPACRVVHSDPDMAALAAGWDAHFQLGPGRPVPERCPGCGWEPITILIEYVDDWGPG